MREKNRREVPKEILCVFKIVYQCSRDMFKDKRKKVHVGHHWVILDHLDSGSCPPKGRRPSPAPKPVTEDTKRRHIKGQISYTGDVIKYPATER